MRPKPKIDTDWVTGAERLLDLVDTLEPAPTQSRRHGHRPRARQHVEIFLLRVARQMSTRRLQARYRLTRRAVQLSVVRGRAILAELHKSGALGRPELEADGPVIPASHPSWVLPGRL